MAYAVVVTVSNRAAAGVYADTTGPLIADALAQAGHEIGAPVVVPDGDPVESALRDAVAAGAHLIVTTGGTGISPTDRTPEATRRVLDYEVPGLAEQMRAEGLRKTPMAALSRSLAGVRGRTLILNLPGSVRGATESLEAVVPVLRHAVDLLAGQTPHPGRPVN